MRIPDLHLLPKIRDSWSYLYVEHCRIDQEYRAIAIHDAGGKTPVPCAVLTLLMLGPGTTITHAAVRTLAENGCLVMWCGEEAVRFYAVGMGETRSSRRLIAQARQWADPASRLAVVVRMYRMRFNESVPDDLTLDQLRGREGIRVRQAYATASRETGIAWEGRSYRSTNWRSADPVNRALSCANSCLYGLCHAAIVSAGFSPTLGFIHTGKMLSFVYDIADLYKTRSPSLRHLRRSKRETRGLRRAFGRPAAMLFARRGCSKESCPIFSQRWALMRTSSPPGRRSSTAMKQHQEVCGTRRPARSRAV
ncbi:MAG: type I-E CRISPR-associated endonuclease Cas1e [Bryobacterales bacterium]|nr:type I-E CRISPR-associated endonuclease Cas1e [Bryobacterales bacterium]